MITSASTDDVDAIYNLIDYYHKTQVVLPRSKQKIGENIQNFFVAVEVVKDERSVVGCSSFYSYNQNLVEIRSLCIDPKYHKKGYGRDLVKHQMEVAKELNIKQLFTLTLQVGFFEKLGFIQVDKSILPNKIFKDCQYCHLRDNCTEQALVFSLGNL